MGVYSKKYLLVVKLFEIKKVSSIYVGGSWQGEYLKEKEEREFIDEKIKAYAWFEADTGGYQEIESENDYENGFIFRDRFLIEIVMNGEDEVERNLIEFSIPYNGARYLYEERQKLQQRKDELFHQWLNA